MQTLLLDVKKDKNAIDVAAKIIKDGGLVAFPTETVYGLGANALSQKACQKIYLAKGRPSDNPLIVHISDEKMLDLIADDISDKAKKLMKNFSPGPLTYIFKAKSILSDTVRGGLSTVGVRIPENEIARKLIEKANTPIAAPSANISGRPSPTRAKDVIFDLDKKVDCILIDEDTSVGIESTIVDVSGKDIKILRPGIITKEQIQEVLKEEVKTKLSATKEMVAPGMKYRHYAPEARMQIVVGKEEEIIFYINENAKQYAKAGIICCDENFSRYDSKFKVSLGSKKDLITVAKNLFVSFRMMNEMQVEMIFCEAFKEEGIGSAIMNRLRKAADNNIMRV